jgi:DNA end-binding protein Ku
VKDAELALARQVIDSLVGDFEPKDELVSVYRGNLRGLLEAKLAGEEIAKPEPVPEAPVIDLMDALRRSVEEAAGKGKAPAKQRRPAKAAAGSRKR